MASLTGNTIQSTYDSLLKVTDNDSITGSLKRITDGLGNNTPLYLSNSAVEIVSALNVTGAITGSNLSGTNTGDETKASIETKLGAATSSNSGYLTSTDWSTFNNKIAGTGTLNKLAKFSSSSSIADSTITDTGSAVTIGVATSVTGSLTASSIIKSGGTASQILAADGSVITAGTNITISGGTISSSGGISGSGTTNYVPKFTGSTSLGNSLIFDNGTNVGINITSPTERLHVVGNGLFSGNLTSGANITSGTGAFDTGGFFIPYSASSASSRNWKITNDQIAFGDFSIKQSSTQAGLPDTYRFYINPTGNVGIGTTTPATRLEVRNNASSPIGWGGVAPFDNRYGELTWDVSQAIVQANSGYALQFNTNGANERMRITSGGNVGIGTTSPSYPLQVRRAGGAGSLGISIDSVGSTDRAVQYFAVQDNAAGAGSGHAFYYRAPSSTTDVLGLFLNEDGNVGIGTSSFLSSTRLELLVGGNSSGSLIGLGNNGSANKLQIISDSGENALFVNTSATPMIFYTSNSERMRISSSGNIAIGDTPSLATSDWSGALSLGKSGTDKVVTGYLSATTNGAVIGGHNSALNAWANLNIAGTNLIFRTNGETERMRITSAGNVGIGCTPNYGKVEIQGATTDKRLYIGTNIYYSNSIDILGLSSIGGEIPLGIAGSQIQYYTNATERMRITSGGNVGIGTSSPGTRLEIRSLAADADRTLPHNILTLTAEQNNAPYGPFGGAILFKNRSYTSGLVESARIRSVIYDDGAPNNFGGGIWFETTPTPGGALTPSLVLNYQGRVGIGTSTPNSPLEVYGQTRISASLGSVCLITPDSTSTNGITIQSSYYGSAGYGPMKFDTGGSERMRIFSGGNVAIGSSTDNNTGAKLQVTGGMTYQNLFNRRTASYTLTINDQNYIVEMNVGSANNLTIPPNSSAAFPIGTEIAIIQYGAGQTTIVAGSGVTLKSKSNALKISGQYAGCTLVKVGTDEWYVIGDLTL